MQIRTAILSVCPRPLGRLEGYGRKRTARFSIMNRLFSRAFLYVVDPDDEISLSICLSLDLRS